MAIRIHPIFLFPFALSLAWAGAPPADDVEAAVLAASDGARGDRLGSAVAVSGDTALVGAYDRSSGQGAAYIFARADAGWTEQARLNAPDAVRFGSSVAIEGATAVVGAYGTSDYRGAGYVFVREGGTWKLRSVLTAPDAMANGLFGYSVAMDGDTVAIGAPGRGAVYVFARTPDGTWGPQAAELTAPDAQPTDGLGNAVAVRGETVLAGAFTQADGRGAAYVFARNESGEWSVQAKLSAPDAMLDDSFGAAVALAGDTAVVGANGKNRNQGAAYVFARAGGEWRRQADLTASDGAANDGFGASVAAIGSTVVVGADCKDGLQGAVYQFVRRRGVWAEEAEVTADDGAPSDGFGTSVAVTEDRVLMGAGGRAGWQGAVYVLGAPGSEPRFNP